MAVVNLTEARIRELPYGSGMWRDEQVEGPDGRLPRLNEDLRGAGRASGGTGRHVRTVPG